jgi:hypothetical protein
LVPKKIDEERDAILVKVQSIDLNWARQLVDTSSDLFLEAARFRLPSAIQIIKCKEATLLNPTHLFLKNLKLTQIETRRHQHLLQQQTILEKKTVSTKSGLYINPTRMFLASKPDGLVSPANGIFRGFPDEPAAIYLQELAMLDLFCTGRDTAFF